MIVVGGQTLGSSPFYVCISLRQTGLKKETGGTKVELSHEKKPEDAKHKAPFVLKFGAQGRAELFGC